MKRERNCRELNLKLYNALDENFAFRDTRYWGLFYHGKNRELRIDIKRFLKMTGVTLTEKQLQIIQSRKTHYFYPKKKTCWGYNCNVFNRTMTEIEADWSGDSAWNESTDELQSGKGGYKELIAQAIKNIKKAPERTVGDDYHFQCGIIDYEEAEMNARMQSQLNHFAYMEKCAEFIISMHAQFFHQMMSKIEAVQIEVLRNNNVKVEHYNREVLKGVGTAKNVNVEELEHYKFLDLGYCVWHFLKHNSLSTYQKLKERFPEVLLDGEFKGGNLAYAYIAFNKEELIEKVYTGCAEFFYEFCKAIWGEDEYEARWNYNTYFEAIVNERIEDIDNPLGLPPWI